MIKRVILFSALLLPILIFVFLKLFGQNEFELPIYYGEVLEDVPVECGNSYEAPYLITSTTLISGSKNTVLIFYDGLTEGEISAFDKQLNRLDEEFQEGDFDLVIVNDSTVTQAEKNCVFLMGVNRAILVDAERRVRGYYLDSSLKEVDRLILELQILLKRY